MCENERSPLSFTMSDSHDLPTEPETEPDDTDVELVAARKRPRPGERRVQILQTLASMLEEPGAERVTTASLAARIGVSEAALYRHFASKEQLFAEIVDRKAQDISGPEAALASASPPNQGFYLLGRITR